MIVPTIELRTLGILELQQRGGLELRSVLAQPRRIALLTYLALDAPRGFHRRDSIIALFWPEHEQRRGRAALRQAVYFLRRFLDEEAIMRRGDELSVDSTRVWCDAVAFELALEEGRVEQALELYRGDLLPGFFTQGAPELEQWLEAQRARLRTRAAECCWLLAEERENAGDTHGAAKLARRAVQLSPGNEVAVRRLMQLLARSGNQSGATEEYDQFVVALRQQYDLEPGPETQALAAALRPPLSAQTSPNGIRRIAVLPFDSVPDELESNALALGLTDDLIQQLSQLPNIVPISRTSVMRYRGVNRDLRQISTALNIGLVVEGTVRTEDQRVRTTVRLVDAWANEHLWGASFDHQVDDVFAIQSEIATCVAQALEIQLTGVVVRRLARKRTPSPEAYRAYMLGRYFLAGVEAEAVKSIAYFQRAIELDACFAQAHAGLGFVYMLSGTHGVIPPRQAFQQAKAATELALSLDDAVWEAQSTRAGLSFWFDWDWNQAAEEFRRAKLTGPSTIADSYIPFCMSVGRLDEGIAEAKRGVHLDPLSSFRWYGLGWAYLVTERFEDAIDQFHAALELRSDFAWARALLALTYGLLHRSENAIEEARKTELLLGADVALHSAVASAYAHAGELSESRRILDYLIGMRPERYVDAWSIALVFASIGDTHETMKWLERAYMERSPFMVYVRLIARTLFRNVSRDPRYEAMIARVGLTDEHLRGLPA